MLRVIFLMRRSLHGSMDWNSSRRPKKSCPECRSLHRSVDWNLM